MNELTMIEKVIVGIMCVMLVANVVTIAVIWSKEIRRRKGRL